MAEDWLIQPRRLETEWCWSDLPPELLSLLLLPLFFRDYRKFELPVAPPCLDSPHFDLPCLMFSDRISSSSWKFFHSLYNEFYNFDFPELMGAEIHFSKDGWLLMSRDDCPLFFFNPLTKVKFELPPTPSSFFSVCFTSPPTSSYCYIFGILSTSVICELEYGLIKFGDHKWRVGGLDNDTLSFWPSNCPPLFHNGVYYCLDSRATNIRKFDPTKEDESPWICFGVCRETNEEDEDEDEDEEEEDEEKEEEEEDEEEEEEENEDEEGIVHDMYMVEVEGDIWAIFLKNNSGQVSVEKLDESELRWKKLESLGDKCLYLSTKGSFAETCMGSDMANKIYFDKFYDKNGAMYCMSSKMYHSIEGSFTSKGVAGNTARNEVYGPGLAQPYNGTWIKPYRG